MVSVLDVLRQCYEYNTIEIEIINLVFITITPTIELPGVS